jgi:glycine C-acetyltransferase
MTQITKRNPNKFLKDEYDELVKNHLEWNIRTLESGSKPHSIVDGKEVIMLCSNNYLNLSNHPRLVKGAIEAAKKYGAGSGSVRVIPAT